MKRITFLPMNITISAGVHDRTAGQLASRSGLGLDQPCGGRGTCGKCRIKVRNATSAPTAAEVKFLSPEELGAGYRLACQCPVEDGLIVIMESQQNGKACKMEVPANGSGYMGKVDPLVREKRISLKMPEVSDPCTSLSDIIKRETGSPGMDIPLYLLRSLPDIFRTAETASALFSDTRLITIQEEERCTGVFGVAIDIGTTSLVVWLADLAAGTVIDTLSELNPQTQFGADVLSRISFINERENGLDLLKNCLLCSLNRMIGVLAERNSISSQDIFAAAVAGNTVMGHVFLGIDPCTIGRSPFIPAEKTIPPVVASRAGLDINPEGEVLMIPGISGYIGGDITSGIEASGMTRSADITLLADIGTNSEIVLGNRDFLLACSAAAGPAFEGARITHGMRAGEGAIERVCFDGCSIGLGVIGGIPPAGICGSGIVDLVGEMLRYGLLDTGGRMADPSGECLRQYISRNPEGVKEFRFSEAFEGDPGRNVRFSQKDVREVQLAKGAIATGIQVLLEDRGLAIEDVGSVMIAGAFGNYLNPDNAAAIGILPGVPAEKIRYIGNSAITGAFHALVSGTARLSMKQIAVEADHIELSSLGDFQKRFIANLHFPADIPARGDRNEPF